MPKLLSLPQKEFLPPVREILSGGLLLGPCLAREGLMQNGTLQVWVPDSTSSIKPANLRHDLFNNPRQPVSFGMAQVEEPLFQLFDGLLAMEGSLLITDTHYSTLRSERPSGTAVSWFSCDSPREEPAQRICAYLAGRPSSDSAYRDLLREASAYPTTLLLTSLNRDRKIECGEAILPEVMTSLVEGAQCIFVGVFDEISFLLWRRTQAQ